MLFGPTAAPAASHEDLTRQQEGHEPGSPGPSMGFLLAMMALIGACLYFFYKRRQSVVSAVFAGSRHSDLSVKGSAPAWVPASVGVLHPSSSEEPQLTDGDEAEFRRLLVESQRAWSRQDVQGLRHLTTPEMYQYFSDTLAENVSAGVENRVEDIIVTRAEVCECWAEKRRVYATVLLQWKARDYVRSLDQSTSDPASVIEGNDRIPTDAREAWTFVRHQQGKWLLSAIQQV
jgi:predicted lipid-binding transport protein (Tim44 family)